MKILIAGSDLNAFLLAKYIKIQDSTHDVYVTTEEPCVDESYTSINIRENDVASICDFVKYNQIEFTIVTSQLSIINGIADIFKKEGFPIFAPFAEAARITFFNSIAKKIMYKLKINTPKFGIFDRENLALEYVRRSRFPIVIENDFTLLARECSICKTYSEAKLGLQKVFENGNEKIVIENYMDTEPLYIYFVTDGFNALPLVSIERTSGENFSIAVSPSNKITENILIKILKQAIYPLLDDISKFACGYTGIIGLKVKLVKDTFAILEFYNGFQYYDFQSFISLSEENIVDVLYSAANGSLADDYDYIHLKDAFSYSVAVNKSEVIEHFEDDEFIHSEDSEKIILTNTASTLTYAKTNLMDYLQEFCSKDVYNRIIHAEDKKELRI
ncbi:MAG: hypothetical protein IJY61_05370 [Candidatus Gastranaerophilales bacterium]|nr:hypothetical protein [Candidatus Gastranaerophilales bacterium]